MRLIKIIILLFIFYSFAWADTQYTAPQYIIEILEDKITVQLFFTSGNEKQTEIKIPHSWGGGARDLELCLHNFKIEGATSETIAPIRANAEKLSLILHHQPFSPIKVSYEFKIPQLTNKVSTVYYPSYEKNFTYFIGQTVLPAIADFHKTANLKLICDKGDQQIITSYGVKNKQIFIKQKPSNILHAFYFCGTPDYLDIKESNLNNNKLYFLGINKNINYKIPQPLYKLYNKYFITPRFESIFSLVLKIINLNQTFFNDYDFPFYLVTYINPKPSSTANKEHFAGGGLK